MPSSKDRDVDVDEGSREKRHRPKTERKDRDRDRDREKDRDRPKDRDRDVERDAKDSPSHRHHRSSRSSKLRPTDSDTHSRSHRRHRPKDMEKDEINYRPPAASSMTDLVPELTRGIDSERGSAPYPSFSKAHSKEFLHSRDNVSAPAARRTDPLTPEATDIGGGSDMRRSKSADSPPATRKASSSRKTSRQDDRPPSPPETDLAGQKERPGTPLSTREGGHLDPRSGSRNSSWVSRSTSKNEVKSRVSKASSQATFILQPATENHDRDGLGAAASSVQSSSAATSVPLKRSVSVPPPRPPPIKVDSSPESAVDSSPKTPTQTPQFPPSIIPNETEHTKFEISSSDVPTPSATPAHVLVHGPPPPPPPPPPPISIQDVPRVDYLMQNGGLPHPVPKTFLAVLPRQNGTRPSNPPLQGPETLFAPFFNLLNQYQTVISGHGSIAVATGHQTIARRLLNRLENVFLRDLSPDGCYCVMCDRSEEQHRGLGWGEVLERVSGRTDLPPWPPFDLALLGTKATEGLVDVPPRPASPVKMDPDIAEEFREHYLRQSKRVRAAVDKWMANCDKSPAPPPQEVDDETLTFAILTNLDPEDRPYFNALLSGSRELLPATRAPTPIRKPRNDFVVKSGLSIQRLYRLPQVPRDAETAMYLVKNPAMHNLLHTISDINPSEWEILISGRFDGFLWSGAEDDGIPFGEGPSRMATPASGIFPSSRVMSPGMSRPVIGGSRNPTPFGPYSRGPTPASFISGVSAASSSYPSRAAVSHDEETEIAVIAEIEREIFNGMEALEDAFERLHDQALTVRANLRRRGAALSMSLQQRRGLGGRAIDVLPLSGSSGAYDRPAWADEESIDGESEWGGDDVSELAPDDSASQISSNRLRRPKRRRERATPAPIEEEDEQ
ncbi:hypothetical protein B0T26DRAFT_33476 [Lasiosphaeria miniovina]|uniref:5-methylcytosine G/T mismatch-specific DNA glycosylase n=1 Tax=Lasiosphaeria miniovina TaxID=1954250 RepID=A0AA40EFW3_9PEZI|nr:uncharacterized protein B0T26DRAFT_33476 [Lasiosphaeria miniovina]KAK0733713.1 hypothetical protein B0T26DRAFT_33476 [Lasiosphaeria miniovina]